MIIGNSTGEFNTETGECKLHPDRQEPADDPVSFVFTGFVWRVNLHGKRIGILVMSADGKPDFRPTVEVSPGLRKQVEAKAERQFAAMKLPDRKG